MTTPRGRSAAVLHAMVAALIATLVAGCSPTPRPNPAPTQALAARTAVPTSSLPPSRAPAASSEPSSAPTTAPTDSPSTPPPPTSPPAADTAIVPGQVNARETLDKAITGYALACYYEVVYVQGGGVLDQIRRQMGSNRFWKAMGTYLEDNRFGLSGTRRLLEALRAASKVNLLPTLRARFPDLY